MNRRSFLKVMAAIPALAAIPPALANALPEKVSDDLDVSIGYYVDNRFNRWSSVKVKKFSESNLRGIYFPQFQGQGVYLISHLEVCGLIFPFADRVVISHGITPVLHVDTVRSLSIIEMNAPRLNAPRFTVGALTLTDE